MGALADYSHLGDPAGMEALASELLLRAESIAAIVDSLARQADDMEFVGPAADQLRREMGDRRRRAERTAGELQGAAHALRRGAATVREQIHELEIAETRARERERER